MVPGRIWPKPAPGAERSQTANTIIFRSKEKKTGSWSRTNKNSSQTKNRPPEPNGPGRILQTIFPKQNWLPETSGPGPQTQTKIFASKQNRLSEPNGTQTSQNKKDQLKLNTCTNNSSKRRQMKNQNYALGIRGTLNTLNKVVAKLAKKPNNPNVGEKTWKAW